MKVKVRSRTSGQHTGVSGALIEGDAHGLGASARLLARKL